MLCVVNVIYICNENAIVYSIDYIRVLPHPPYFNSNGQHNTSDLFALFPVCDGCAQTCKIPCHQQPLRYGQSIITCLKLKNG